MDIRKRKKHLHRSRFCDVQHTGMRYKLLREGKITDG